MISLGWLIPIALAMGAFGLVAFLWSLRNGQYDDLDGAAVRILSPEASERPLPGPDRPTGREPSGTDMPQSGRARP